MKLELTDIEFCLLTDLVVAGDWVINACRAPGNYIQPYHDMAEMIMDRYIEQKGLQSEHDIKDILQDRLDVFFDFYKKQTMYSDLAEHLANQNYGEGTANACNAFTIYLDELTGNNLKSVKIEISDIEEQLKTKKV